MYYLLRAENIYKYNLYTTKIMKINREGIYRIAYIDENYVYKNYYY